MTVPNYEEWTQSDAGRYGYKLWRRGFLVNAAEDKRNKARAEIERAYEAEMAAANDEEAE